MFHKHTPKPERKLKQWYTNQKESSKEILVFSWKVIFKYSGHMFVVILKPKPAWHLAYRVRRMKIQQNLTTRKRRIFFKNNLLVFFTKEPNARVPVLDKKTEVNLPNINIVEELVRNEILKLNLNKSCGLDKMHPQILIELVDLVSKPLALLLNKTMDEEYIPQDWKMTYVSLIFEKGAKNNADNCRPISLISIVCKLIDSLVKNSIMTHMRAENLLSSKQYGFINGRFTTI